MCGRPTSNVTRLCDTCLTQPSTERVQNFQERPRPLTVTRGLPYMIGHDYVRLRRLVREYSHMQAWRGYQSRRMIESQCEKLHYRVYGEMCYYGGLPSEFYAYDSNFM
jgi:hypothetical protein